MACFCGFFVAKACPRAVLRGLLSLRREFVGGLAMRPYLPIAVVCFAVGLPTALAGEFEAAPNATYAIDLDTDEGRFSEWKLTDLRGLNAARGKVTFVQLRVHERWAPGLNIALGDGDDRVQFTVVSPTRKPPLLAMLETHGKIPKHSEVFAFGPELNEPFGLEIEWTPQGKVTVTIRTKAAQAVNGFERHELDLGRAPTWFRFGGSTSEVSVEPLMLGRIKP
jgi:hypothetical protein